MEVNLLMGGRGETAACSPVQDDPPLRMLRAVGNARRTLRAGFTTVRNLGLFVKTGGYLLDVALAKAIDAGWIDGPRVVPAGHAITPTGGHLDPTMFARVLARRAAAERRGGHRRRRRRGAQGRPVPDQARREADQGVRLGRGHVAHRGGRRAALLRRGAARDRGRGAPARPAGGGAHARGGRGAGRRRGRHRLHRARLPHRRRHDRAHGQARHVPGADHVPGRRDGRVARGARAPGQGGGDVPPGAGVGARPPTRRG